MQLLPISKILAFYVGQHLEAGLCAKIVTGTPGQPRLFLPLLSQL